MNNQKIETNNLDDEIDYKQINRRLLVYQHLIFKCESIYDEHRDYNRAVKVIVINYNDKLIISTDVMKVLIMLKFNNIFLNICNYDDISITGATRHNNDDVNGNIKAAEFIITFEQSLSSYYFKKFNEMKLAKSNPKFIPKEHLEKIQFQLFR